MLYLEIKALLILHFHSSGQTQKILIHTKKFILFASVFIGPPPNMYCLVHRKDQKTPLSGSLCVFYNALGELFSPLCVLHVDLSAH